jgi:phospholipid transport system substrate-binding protein
VTRPSRCEYCEVKTKRETRKGESMTLRKQVGQKVLRVILNACVVLCLALAAQAEEQIGADASEPVAEAASESPTQSVEAFHAGLLDIMKQAKVLGIQGRIDKLEPLMARTFDMDFMASKTVGRHWSKLSDEDKARWVKIFARFTTANYAGRFTGFTGERFETVGVEEAARNTRVVLTRIVVPNEEDVQLNYRLMQRGGEWRVIDVYLNGTVSELALRRSEYSSALKREGFEELVASIETKIQDLKDNG